MEENRMTERRPEEKKIVERRLPEILKTNCKYDPVLVGYALLATDIQNYIEEFVKSKKLDGFSAARVFIKKPESAKPEIHARCYFSKHSKDIGLKVEIPDQLRDRMDAMDNFRPSRHFIENMAILVNPHNYISTYNKDFYSVSLNIFKVLNLMFAVDYHSQEIVVDTAMPKKKGGPLVINVVKQYKSRNDNDGDIFTNMIRNEVDRR